MVQEDPPSTANIKNNNEKEEVNMSAVTEEGEEEEEEGESSDISSASSSQQQALSSSLSSSSTSSSSLTPNDKNCNHGHLLLPPPNDDEEEVDFQEFFFGEQGILRDGKVPPTLLTDRGVMPIQHRGRDSPIPAKPPKRHKKKKKSSKKEARMSQLDLFFRRLKLHNNKRDENIFDAEEDGVIELDTKSSNSSWSSLSDPSVKVIQTKLYRYLEKQRKKREIAKKKASEVSFLGGKTVLVEKRKEEVHAGTSSFLPTMLEANRKKNRRTIGACLTVTSSEDPVFMDDSVQDDSLPPTPLQKQQQQQQQKKQQPERLPQQQEEDEEEEEELVAAAAAAAKARRGLDMTPSTVASHEDGESPAMENQRPSNWRQVAASLFSKSFREVWDYQHEPEDNNKEALPRSRLFRNAYATMNISSPEKQRFPSPVPDHHYDPLVHTDTDELAGPSMHNENNEDDAFPFDAPHCVPSLRRHIQPSLRDYPPNGRRSNRRNRGGTTTSRSQSTSTTEDDFFSTDETMSSSSLPPPTQIVRSAVTPTSWPPPLQEENTNLIQQNDNNNTHDNTRDNSRDDDDDFVTVHDLENENNEDGEEQEDDGGTAIGVMKKKLEWLYRHRSSIGLGIGVVMFVIGVSLFLARARLETPPPTQAPSISPSLRPTPPAAFNNDFGSNGPLSPSAQPTSTPSAPLPLWIPKGQEELTGQRQGDRFGNSVALSFDGRVVAAGTNLVNNATGYIGVYDLETTDDIFTLQTSEAVWTRRDQNSFLRAGAVTTVALSRDGSVVAFAYDDNIVEAHRYNGRRWTQINRDLRGYKDFVMNEDASILAVVASSTGLVSVFEDGGGGLWIRRGRGETIPITDEADKVLLSMSANGNVLVVGNSVVIDLYRYEPSLGGYTKIINTMRIPSTVRLLSLSLSSDGQRLAIMTSAYTEVWQLQQAVSASTSLRGGAFSKQQQLETWTRLGSTITTPVSAISLSFQDATLVIGLSQSVQIYGYDDGWTMMMELPQRGIFTSLSVDANTLALGDPTQDQNRGSCRVMARRTS